MENKKKIRKGLFKVLTGVVVGGAIGSILGLSFTKKGAEIRKDIRDKSMEVYLEGKAKIKEVKPAGFFKRMIIKLLKPKNKNETKS